MKVCVPNADNLSFFIPIELSWTGRGISGIHTEIWKAELSRLFRRQTAFGSRTGLLYIPERILSFTWRSLFHLGTGGTIWERFAGGILPCDGLLVEGLETAPCSRHKGYAKMLLEETLPNLPERRVYSHINRDNRYSIEVHLSCGFSRISDCSFYIDGSVDYHCDTYMKMCDTWFGVAHFLGSDRKSVV